MENPTDHYWQLKLGDVADALTANNFEVHISSDLEAAHKLVMETLLPASGAQTVSFGGSMTVIKSGIYDALKSQQDLAVIDTIDPTVPPEEKIERRRQALLVDLFITGTNAITEAGQLVNLDMIGNRVGALTFGPKKVVLVVGRNKIVPDLEAAVERIKAYTSPTNAMRLDMQTPCVKTGRCEECRAPARICNTWTITEKAYPKGRVSVVLINAEAGL
jgi:L-lactate utilization protein LutC